MYTPRPPKRLTCINCGCHFYGIRSDMDYCSPACRKAYYTRMRPSIREIRCQTCPNRADKGGTCSIGVTFNGKTHPRNCPLL